MHAKSKKPPHIVNHGCEVASLLLNRSTQLLFLHTTNAACMVEKTNHGCRIPEKIQKVKGFFIIFFIKKNINKCAVISGS